VPFSTRLSLYLYILLINGQTKYTSLFVVGIALTTFAGNFVKFVYDAVREVRARARQWP